MIRVAIHDLEFFGLMEHWDRIYDGEVVYHMANKAKLSNMLQLRLGSHIIVLVRRR